MDVSVSRFVRISQMSATQLEKSRLGFLDDNVSFEGLLKVIHLPTPKLKRHRNRSIKALRLHTCYNIHLYTMWLHKSRYGAVTSRVTAMLQYSSARTVRVTSYSPRMK